MQIKRIGILRGGEGSNYFSSLKVGGEIIAHIAEYLSDKYKVVDILVDKDGVWHVGGLPETPHDLVHKVDLVWNVADPTLSVTLENFSIPCVSKNFFSSTLEKSSDLLREHIKKLNNVNMPRSLVLPVYQEDFDGDRSKYAIKKAKEVHEKFGAPWIVKSFTPDANMGIHLAKTFNELVAAIEDGVKHEKSILVEEFIEGKVSSVHSLAGFRNQDIYTFPFGNTYGVLSSGEKERLAGVASDLHRHLGANHYLKSDFVITPRGKVYLLNVSLDPDLKEGSHLAEVCELTGAKIHHLTSHIIEGLA